MTTRSPADQRPTSGPADSVHGRAASADIVGILDTVTIPIVVVGRDCTLVRFNRAAREVFAFASTDVGLRLSNISALADVKDVETLCGQAMADEAEGAARSILGAVARGGVPPRRSWEEAAHSVPGKPDGARHDQYDAHTCGECGGQGCGPFFAAGDRCERLHPACD